MSFSQRHWRHAILVGLLVITGFSLYLASWRSALGPLMPAVQIVHEWGGVVYGVALIGWSMRFYPWPREHGSPPFTKWAFFFLVMLFVSGMGLLVGPSWTRSIATVVHGLFAGIFVIWVAYHLVVHWPVSVNKNRQPRINFARRRMLRWVVGAVVTASVLEAVPSVLTMVSGRVFQKGSNNGALPGFVPYTVVGGYPNIALETWRLTVDGVPDRKDYTLEQLMTFGIERRHINFQCVTGWAVDGIEFTGIDLENFLSAVGWQPVDHPWILFYSGDGVYTESLSADQISQYRPLLAYQIDSRPLPQSQGYPLRLLVPGMYGYKSIKWLVRIELASHDVLGFWEQRGYPENAYFGSYMGV
ncbi:MAG: molybdopterin-dependent oxidoreductase [Firmicutes bacterium]|nr:molybdopterin-dependent oxidoreductase [Bacillota bacterium]